MKFRKDINGLRAFAVLAVILFHFKVAGFTGGFAGVDIFFVISGYLMTGIIFGRIREQKFSLIEFYLHRAKRIVPALAVLCLAMIAFGYLCLLTPDYRELIRTVKKVMLFSSNHEFYSQSGYFDTPSQENWLLHTWSLSVEWQFYLIYPIVVLLLRKWLCENITKAILIVALLGSLAVSIFYTPIDRSAAFYFLPTRAWEMLAGGIIFLFPVVLSESLKKLLEYAGFAIILVAIFSLEESMLWPGYLATIPVIGTMLVLIANRDSIITANFFCQWLGKISYSVYLWHWPIAVFLLICGLSANSIAIIIGIGLSLLLGNLSYFLVEKRFNLQWRVSLELLKYIAIAGLIIGLASLMGSLVKHQPQIRQNFLFSKSFQQIDDIVLHKIDPFTKMCLLSQNAPPSPNCIVGQGKVNLIVLGDSHASVLFPAILQANQKGASMLWAMGGCPFIEGAKYKEKVYEGCTHFVPDRLKRLESVYPQVPILISNYLTPYFNENKLTMYFTSPQENITQFKNYYRRAYLSTMCQLAKTRPVYVLQPIPSPPYNVPKKMAINRMLAILSTGNTQSLTYPQHSNSFIIEVMKEAQQQCGINLLDPVPFFCQNGICKVDEKATPLYFDGNHLTKYGSMKLIPLFQPIINQSFTKP